jgi:hypothetical protein
VRYLITPLALAAFSAFAKPDPYCRIYDHAARNETSSGLVGQYISIRNRVYLETREEAMKPSTRSRKRIAFGGAPNVSSEWLQTSYNDIRFFGSIAVIEPVSRSTRVNLLCEESRKFSYESGKVEWVSYPPVRKMEFDVEGDACAEQGILKEESKKALYLDLQWLWWEHTADSRTYYCQ